MGGETLSLHYWADQEQRFPSPPTMIRPLAAIGEVHWRTPEQVFVLVKIVAPVSPSTPISLPLLMYQTTTSLVPSVVVEMGPVTGPESGAHQATVGLGGD